MQIFYWKVHTHILGVIISFFYAVFQVFRFAVMTTKILQISYRHVFIPIFIYTNLKKINLLQRETICVFPRPETWSFLNTAPVVRDTWGVRGKIIKSNIERPTWEISKLKYTKGCKGIQKYCCCCIYNFRKLAPEALGMKDKSIKPKTQILSHTYYTRDYLIFFL